MYTHTPAKETSRKSGIINQILFSKLCMIGLSFAPYMEVLCKGIASHGVQVLYVTPGPIRSYWKPTPESFATNYKRVFTRAFQIPIKSQVCDAISPRVIRLLLTRRFDAVVVTLGYPSSLLYLILAKFRGAITVGHITAHNYSLGALMGFVYSMGLRISTYLTNAVITLTDFQKDFLTKIGVADNKISTIPHSVDISKFILEKNNSLKDSLGIASNAKVVLFVGTLVYRKGVDYLIEAFDDLVNKKRINAHLVIVGEGSERERLKQKVVSKRLEGHVLFTGVIPHSSVYEYYSMCDVFVAPSLATGTKLVEPFGLVYLEAMASGRPVIAFDIPAPLSRLIIDERTGFLVEEGNVELLAERISELLENDEKSRKMGLEARRIVKMCYDSRVIASRWVETLECAWTQNQ